MLNLITRGPSAIPPVVGFNRGYSVGGSSFANTLRRMYSLTFDTEVIAPTLQPLTKSNCTNASAVSTTLNGYFSISSVLEKFNYGQETTTSTGISTTVSVSGGSYNYSTIKGYFYTVNGGSPGARTLTFASETIGVISAITGVGKSGQNGTGSATNSYMHGGSTVSTLNYKMPYATETFSTLSAVLTLGREGNSSFSSSTKGYISGSFSYSDKSTDVFNFSTETIAAMSTSLAYAAYACSAFSAPTKGYYMACSNGAPQFNLTCFIVFSNDTVGTLGNIPGGEVQQDPVGMSPSLL